MNETGNMSECIERFHSNELDKEDLIRFLYRLEKDPIMRREVLLDKELNVIFSDENLLELSEKLQRIREKYLPGRNNWEPFLIAASVIFLFTFGILMLIVEKNIVKSPNDQPVTERYSEKIKKIFCPIGQPIS